MTLVSNWREVLTRAWSVRLTLLAAILTGVEFAVPFLDGYLPIPQKLFAGLAGLTAAGAFVARLIAQSNISPK